MDRLHAKIVQEPSLRKTEIILTGGQGLSLAYHYDNGRVTLPELSGKVGFLSTDVVNLVRYLNQWDGVVRAMGPNVTPLSPHELKSVFDGDFYTLSLVLTLDGTRVPVLDVSYDLDVGVLEVNPRPEAVVSWSDFKRIQETWVMIRDELRRTTGLL